MTPPDAARGVTPEPPFVSVVVPCRNEIRHIDACLASVASTTYPPDRLEVLVVDGMSDDGTRDRIGKHAGSVRVRLLDNAARTAPAAMNVGIRAARGSVIVRMDAHCAYPDDYIPKLVHWLQTSGADNVGGVCRTRPADESPKARAIAIAVSHPFGVGNSYFRIGTAEPRWVDTVPFGCFRRGIFDRIGLFDEELVRNQDDELNARLIQAGGRILLIPEIVSEYYARESLGKLWRMYWQYGLFKPLAARKLGRVTTLRQLVPALFVTALLLAGTLAVLQPAFRTLALLPYAVYLAAVSFAAWFAGRAHGTPVALWLVVVFPVLHLAYGLGFIWGAALLLFRRDSLRSRSRKLAPSR